MFNAGQLLLSAALRLHLQQALSILPATSSLLLFLSSSRSSLSSHFLLPLIDLCRFLRSSRLHVQPALEGKNTTREKQEKKDGAVAAWSNVSGVMESQLYQLGQSPSRTIARRHFNAYHTATFASPCVRAPAFVNWSLTQDALKWWSCLVLPYVIIVTYPMTRRCSRLLRRRSFFSRVAFFFFFQGGLYMQPR